MANEPTEYTSTFSVCFSRPGLTPSYQLKDRDEKVVSSKTTNGVIDVGNGEYRAFIPIPLNFKGKLEWCSEEGVPEFKHEVIGREFTDELRKRLQELSQAEKDGKVDWYAWIDNKVEKLERVWKGISILKKIVSLAAMIIGGIIWLFYWLFG